MSVTMALFFGSGAFIFVLIALRYVELKRGLRFAENIRTKLDVAAQAGFVLATHTVPRKIAHWSAHIAAKLTHFCSVVLLRLVLKFEHHLVGLINKVRGKRELHHRKASSSFFEDISLHKKQANGDRKNGYYEK